MWKVKSSLKNWRNERLLSFRVFVKILTALIYLMWWWFLVRPWLCTRPPYKLSYSYYYCYYTIIIIIIVIRIITSITIIINLRPFIDIIKHWYTHSHGCTEIPEEILTWRLPHQLDRSRIPPPRLPPLGHIWDVMLVWRNIEEYWKNCLCVTVLYTIITVHKGMSSSYRSVDCIGRWSYLV